MISPADSWIGHPLGVAPVKLTFAPISNQELPRLFAADELTGGSFKADRQGLELLCDQIFGVERDWLLHSDELLVDWGSVAPLELAAQEVEDTPNTSRVMSCAFLCFRILVAPRTAKKDLHTVVTRLFVDHAWAMTFGRELFGFPALFAVFEQTDDGVAIKLDGGVPGELATAVVLAWNTPRGSVPPPAGSFWEMIRASPSNSALRTIPFVQSKQMRDGLQATRACYQTLVEGQIGVDTSAASVRSASLTLTFEDEKLFAASDLGLASPARSVSGYRTQALKLSVQVESAAQTPIVRSGREGPSLRQRRGDPQAAPPYLFTNVDIVGFRLPVRRDLLQNLCDIWLNAPFPGRSYRYEPANVDLVVECLHYPAITAENPPFGVSREDLKSQRELVFRILVGRVDEDGQTIRAPAVFCPFVFVDSTWSLISGREVIGYPKLLAEFKAYPAQGQPFDACKINAVTPNPTTRWKERPLLTMDCRFGRTPRDPEELFAQPPLAAASGTAPLVVPVQADFAWWGLGELQSGGANPETFIEPWLSGQTYGYAGVQVKRFNDARSVRRPCYHELVECDYTLLKAAVSLPLHDATLYFPEADVYGIAEAFGFAPIVPVPPGSWYRTKADFAFNVTDPLA